MRKIAVSGLLSIFNKLVIALLSVGLFSGLKAQEDKPIIGVVGLDNRGGIGEAAIDTLCNRISTLLENSSKYLVLQRDFVPIVLQEQGFMITSGICSSIDGLTAAGLLLSADEVIGGSIIKDGNGITLELMRIRVSDRTQLAKQKITSFLSRQDFLNFELPGVVGKLISEPQMPARREAKLSEDQRENESNFSVVSDSKVKRKRKRRAISFITTGVVIGAAAAAGSIYYLGDRAEKTSDELPLGTLPQRTP